jgi:hypothetical protein
MEKATIKQAKKYIFGLIGYNGRVPLYALTQDSCSEISRLLGVWLYKKFPKAKIYIYKGRVGGRLHDLLLIQKNGIYVIDPTVWQFFKNKKSILIAKENSIDAALAALTQCYGGKWKLSESVESYSSLEIEKLKTAVKKNLF